MLFQRQRFLLDFKLFSSTAKIVSKQGKFVDAYNVKTWKGESEISCESIP